MYIHTYGVSLCLFRHGSGGANFRLVRFTLSATLQVEYESTLCLMKNGVGS